MFFVCVGLLGGDTPSAIWKQLRHDFWPTLGLEYTLWTPIDITNFALIPVQHQLLVVNIACLLESIMLSFIKHGNTNTKTTNSEDGNDDAVEGVSSFLNLFTDNKTNTQKEKNPKEKYKENNDNKQKQDGKEVMKKKKAIVKHVPLSSTTRSHHSITCALHLPCSTQAHYVASFQAAT